MSSKGAYHLIGKRMNACDTKRKIHKYVFFNPGLKGIEIARRIKMTRGGVYPHLARLVIEGKLKVTKDPNSNKGKLYYSVQDPSPDLLERIRPTDCFGKNNLMLKKKPMILTNNGEDMGFYIPKDLMEELGLDEKTLSEVSGA